ncbi:hypothetical protein AB0M20_05160 [Actinoplanes sp. NPDC051633]|uniref:hypothetical protein n=1 Tax=Actinoplanes sp. NPDC051633 TaxID=3155670 RepID=UPI003418106E
MQSKKRTAALVGAGGLAAAGVAGFALLAGPAQAEPAPSASGSAPAAPAAPQPDPSGSASAPAAPGTTQGRPDPAARQQELAAALAKELGIDQAKVAAALEKVRTDQQNAAKADRIAELRTRLDAAVKDGKLTAEQRDAILKAAEAGVLPGGGPGGGLGGWGGRGHGPR